MIWPVELERQREAICRMWAIFPTSPEVPIHLRAIWPKGIPGKAPPKNFTFTPTAYPEVADRQAAFEAKALELNAFGYNIYTTLNPIVTGFAGDEHNGVAVKDQDIACRRYLLLDFDRAATAQPATDEEIDEIFRCAFQIEKAVFYDKGHQPLTVFSGNGAHVYIPLANLPNNDEAKALCQRMLRAFAAKFDTATVKVDISVHNAGRITKVPGTVARKGLETEERPYRMAHVIV